MEAPTRTVDELGGRLSVGALDLLVWRLLVGFRFRSGIYFVPALLFGFLEICESINLACYPSFGLNFDSNLNTILYFI